MTAAFNHCHELDPEYHWNFVTFLVDNCRFRVPEHRFQEGSEVFAEEYGLQVNATPNDFEMVENVVELYVNIDDFRPFLRALYPRSSNETVTFTKCEWLSVLGLSSEWYFNDLRRVAIEKLTELSMSPIERVRFGRLFDITAWLSSGYVDLVTRPESLKLDEAEELGWEIAMKLCAMREANIRQPSDVAQTVHQSFFHELLKIAVRQAAFMTKDEKKESERRGAELAKKFAAAAAEEQKKAADAAALTESKRKEAEGLETRRLSLLEEASALEARLASGNSTTVDTTTSDSISAKPTAGDISDDAWALPTPKLKKKKKGKMPTEVLASYDIGAAIFS
ncbi:hypothetical protein FA15DRAFT_670318 [Coprinopsis marcescibilis]|uniref:BTB domain-containing protein n=1 Tax=Coprinopsis marcescibilis TaxID=230819 RepID=A0A5C3KSV7_COPMA|nr:hypothetical protein FA15DRAFT_670318 [Coprinopsis marcescibilis]